MSPDQPVTHNPAYRQDFDPLVDNWSCLFNYCGFHVFTGSCTGNYLTCGCGKRLPNRRESDDR